VNLVDDPGTDRISHAVINSSPGRIDVSGMVQNSLHAVRRGRHFGPISNRYRQVLRTATERINRLG